MNIFDMQLASICNLLQIAKDNNIDISEHDQRTEPTAPTNLTVVNGIAFMVVEHRFIPVFQAVDGALLAFTSETYPTETALWKIESKLVNAIKASAPESTVATYGAATYESVLSSLGELQHTLQRNTQTAQKLLEVCPVAGDDSKEWAWFIQPIAKGALLQRVKQASAIAITALADLERALAAPFEPAPVKQPVGGYERSEMIAHVASDPTPKTAIPAVTLPVDPGMCDS